MKEKQKERLLKLTCLMLPPVKYLHMLHRLHGYSLLGFLKYFGKLKLYSLDCKYTFNKIFIAS